jgi:hypothetical protein
MKRYRFEIVRRAIDRFGWIFVRIDDKGRRVLARSERSYPSRKRVWKAIAALEDAQGCIVDTTKGYPRFALPAKSFKLVPCVPLIVDEFPVEAYDTSYKVSAEDAGKNDDRAADREAAVPATGKKGRRPRKKPK